ncbi:hypothetical protein G7048_23035 [Diaphorobacter sp. HDW4B]|uniref:hypothetical protein n=1 Tax=Diaphorobacter sp. HDW4B TaxID=2714925 RepID=UPI001408D249|nr:hypothetical protein [Diaphorobacter sp. HDW4B]QIL72970.1 hypothetical protein G7048_23035 [Diaphorobacter sp. HDW4B]
MKAIAFIALTAVASAAFAAGPVRPGSITISGVSEQKTYANDSTVKNTSGTNNKALQNVASNAADVEVFGSGKSYQTADLKETDVRNEAKGDYSVARQNIASNNGEVDIKGTSTQYVNANKAMISNMADGAGAKATQNIASNFGNVTVAANATSYQYASLTGRSAAINLAKGSLSTAVQNISSNDACAEDPCPGGRCH